jgi:plastocyanin
MRGITKSSLAAVAAIALACGGSSNTSSPGAAPAPAPQGPGFFITISNSTFSPSTLRVPPGGTVTVVNTDATLHSVTSESSMNAFTPGAVSGVQFDTGAFSGTMSFTLPMSAPSGTVVPFYCTVHLQTMSPPNGSITIDPTATASTAPVTPVTPVAPMGGGGGYLKH